MGIGKQSQAEHGMHKKGQRAQDVFLQCVFA
jgi:hypothetical protein